MCVKYIMLESVSSYLEEEASVLKYTSLAKNHLRLD